METKKTSVDLAGQALRVYEQFANTYGGNNILSAGLVLFGRLSPDEREALIADVNDSALLELALEHSRDRLDRLVEESLPRVLESNPALVNYILRRARAADQAQVETPENNGTDAG